MIVRRSALNAALAATTADDTRYFLNAVQLDPAKHTVTGTNGHIAIRARENEPIADEDFPLVPGAEFHDDPLAPFCLPADLARSLIAAMPKRSTLPVLETIRASQNGSPSTIVIAATDLQAPRVATINTAEPDAPRFPQIDRVFPDANRPELTVCLAVDVLETLIKAAKAISGKRGKITFGLPTKHTAVVEAIRITIAGVDGLSIDSVAMPCRM